MLQKTMKLLKKSKLLRYAVVPVIAVLLFASALFGFLLNAATYATSTPALLITSSTSPLIIAFDLSVDSISNLDSACRVLGEILIAQCQSAMALTVNNVTFDNGVCFCNIMRNEGEESDI